MDAHPEGSTQETAERWHHDDRDVEGWARTGETGKSAATGETGGERDYDHTAMVGSK